MNHQTNQIGHQTNQMNQIGHQTNQMNHDCNIDVSKSDVEENSDEEIREFPIHEYYIHGLYDIHISDIINTVGIQFETMSDAFAWRLQKLKEMKEWDWEEANEYEFPFLVCVNEKRFITPMGSTMHFSRFLKN